MSCKPFADKLEAYVLGLLDERERAAVEQHLLACPDCRRKAAVHQQAARLIEKAFDQNPPDNLRAKVMADLKAAARPKLHWSYWAAPGVIGAAALLLIIKIQPVETVKKQAGGTAVVEQTGVARMPATPLPAAKRKTAPAGKAEEATAAEKKMSAADLPGQMPQGRTRGGVENGPLAVRPSVSGFGEESGGPQLEKYAPATHADEMPAPEPEPGAVAGAAGARLNRAKTAPAALHDRPLRAEAPAVFAVCPEREARVPERPASAGGQKTLASSLSLVAVKGELNSMQVGGELDRLRQVLADRLEQEGDARAVKLSIAVDPQGRVVTAGFLGEAFKSDRLNLYIMEKVRALRFEQPRDSKPATVIIAIIVK